MTSNIKICNKIVGDGAPCFIIAEAGVNHNGQISLAKKMVDVAVRAGESHAVPGEMNCQTSAQGSTILF